MSPPVGAAPARPQDARRRLRGFTVAVDDPYKGMGLVRRHRDPARGRRSIRVEVNRRLFMDETTIARTGGHAAAEAAPRRPTAAVRDPALRRAG